MNRMYMYQSQSPNSSPTFSLSIHLFLLYICVSISVLQVRSVQFSSVAQSRLSLCDPIDCSTPGFPVHHQLLELAQTHVHRVCDAIQPSHLMLSCLQSFPASESFSKESVLCIRWPKYWSFSFSISPSNEYSGLISFKIDWFNLLAVQGTLKVFSNTTVQKHQFFSAQLSLWSSSHIHTWLLDSFD